MEYRLLGSSGCAVSALALGTLTFGNETDQATSFSQLGPGSPRPGEPWWTVPTCTPTAARRRSSAAGWPPGRGHVSLSCWPPRAGFPPMKARTGTGCPAASVAGPGRVAARAERGDHRPVPGSRLGPADPDRGDAALPGRTVAPGRSTTSGCPTSPAGSCRKQWTSRSSAGFPPRCRCSRSQAAGPRGPWEIAPAAGRRAGLLAWSPLASGWLTGKYRRDEAPAAGTRVVENADEGMRIWNQRGQSGQTWQVLDVARKVAEGRGVSLAQLAVAWLMARPAVSS